MTDASTATGPPASSGAEQASSRVSRPEMQWARIAGRWAFFLAALFVVGPITGMLTGRLHAADGGDHATPLVSTAPSAGAIGLVLVFALATTIGVPAGRVFGTSIGFRCAGLVLIWAAGRTGNVAEIIRASDSSEPLRVLAAEGAIVGVLLLLLTSVLIATGSAPHRLERDAFPPGPRAAVRDLIRLFTPVGGATVLATLIGAGVVAWIVAIAPMRGQAVAAGILAGLGGGAAGRLAGASIDDKIPPIAHVVGMALLAVLAPLVGLLMHGGSARVVEAAYAQELFAPARLVPLDWAAGAVLGLPIGIHWACSMTHRAGEDEGAHSRA